MILRDRSSDIVSLAMPDGNLQNQTRSVKGKADIYNVGNRKDICLIEVTSVKVFTLFLHLFCKYLTESQKCYISRTQLFLERRLKKL